MDASLIVIMYIIYAVIVLLVRWGVKTLTPVEVYGVLDWLTIVSLVVPILGLVGSALLFRYSIETDATDLLDYEETLRFDVLPYDEWRNDAAHSITVMPIALSIESGRQDVSRELIIRHIHLLTKGQGTYLKKAVQNASTRPELAHYASTTYHLLNDRHLKRIQQLESHPVVDEHQQLTSLYQAYRAYWKSELLSEIEQERLLQKQTRLLERLIELNPDDTDAYRELGEVFAIQDKNSRQVIIHYRKAIFRFPDILVFQEKLIETLIYQDNWKEATRLLASLEERDQLRATTQKFQEVIRSLWTPQISS